MPDLISLPFIVPDIKQFDPTTKIYHIGQECKTCGNKILHHQSISVCQCHLYCHSKCFITELNQTNKDKDQISFFCKICMRRLQLSYETEVKFKLHAKKLNIFLIFSAVCCLPLFLIITFGAQHQRASAFLLGFIISWLFLILVFGIVNTLYVKESKVIGIKSTCLDLLISAFADLEKGSDDEQTTHTQMVK